MSGGSVDQFLWLNTEGFTDSPDLKYDLGGKGPGLS